MAVEVYPGNAGDPTTVPDQVEKLRGRFGLSRVVLAGDRGMLTVTVHSPVVFFGKIDLDLEARVVPQHGA